MAKINTAMILAAGLGTRMKPISDVMPKPLIPVLNLPNIMFTLFGLKKAGIKNIVINLYHLASDLEKFLGDGSKWGVKINYSYEAELLGTGGGVKHAEGLLDGTDIILANSDFVTNLDIRAFVQSHVERNGLWSFALIEDPSRSHLYSKVGVNQAGHLCSLPFYERELPSRTGIFTGFHVLNRDVLGFLKDEYQDILKTAFVPIKQNAPERVFGYFLNPQQYWWVTGELPTYFQTSMKLLDYLKQSEPWLRRCLSESTTLKEHSPGIWVQEGMSTEALTLKAPAVIGKAKIRDGATIGPYAVVGEGSVIDCELLQSTIALPGAKISASTSPVNEIFLNDKSIYNHDTK